MDVGFRSTVFKIWNKNKQNVTETNNRDKKVNMII